MKAQPELLVTSVPRESLVQVATVAPFILIVIAALSSQPAEPLSKLI